MMGRAKERRGRVEIWVMGKMKSFSHIAEQSKKFKLNSSRISEILLCSSASFSLSSDHFLLNAIDNG